MHNNPFINWSLFLCLFLFTLFTHSVQCVDILPPHRRPFPTASIVAASIAGGIVFAGMALACLLALPRVLLFIRARLLTDEEEEEEAAGGQGNNEDGNHHEGQKNEIEMKSQHGANTSVVTGN
ncbi:hypothetical protein C9374_006631 [Naegleria lovaniensis]|uniref:Uncharacterized protein n=1 Tax=Naegleria lovaniensis TaxID=51637 RepID=A0AA88KM37_NAELO|nr:uncharacterized protein C9374_006631 [Naegleria lovaniensis]KAG2379514.1 hypothetical protein C9374_006631 [Naegleria lovaniensis]